MITPAVLPPASVQLLSFVQAMGAIPMAKIDYDPLTFSDQGRPLPPAVQRGGLRDYMEQVNISEHNLLASLFITNDELVTAFETRNDVRNWFQNNSDRFPWVHVPGVPRLLVDDLFHLHAVSTMVSRHYEHWGRQQNRFQVAEPKLVTYVQWLRDLLVGRVQLAIEAVDTDQWAHCVGIYFDINQRESLGIQLMKVSAQTYLSLNSE